MKTSPKIFHVNPIGRDLAILIFTGMLLAIGLISVGLILLNQL